MEKREAYNILSDLIFKGFLCTRMNLCGNLFVFKTITERELELIRGLLGDITKGLMFYSKFMAFSVFSINGKNILADRHIHMGDLSQFFSNIPSRLFNRIMAGLNERRDDALNAFKFIEGFSYTDWSRHRWKSSRGISDNIESFTGIPGSNSLGINIHQENWIFINGLLDDEEKYNNDFSNAILIASASNPKGVRRVKSQFDGRLRNNSEKRKRLAELGYEGAPVRGAEGWAAPVDTREELVAELERQMAGVKDRHDKFIDGYMKKLKDGAERIAQEAKARMEKNRDLPAIEMTQRVVSNEEMQEMMKKRSYVATVADSEDSASPQDKEHFYKKIGHRVITGR